MSDIYFPEDGPTTPGAVYRSAITPEMMADQRWRNQEISAFIETIKSAPTKRDPNEQS